MVSKTFKFIELFEGFFRLVKKFGYRLNQIDVVKMFGKELFGDSSYTCAAIQSSRMLGHLMQKSLELLLRKVKIFLIAFQVAEKYATIICSLFLPKLLGFIILGAFSLSCQPTNPLRYSLLSHVCGRC